MSLLMLFTIAGLLALGVLAALARSLFARPRTWTARTRFAAGAIIFVPGFALAQAAGTPAAAGAVTSSPIIPTGVWGTIIAGLIGLALSMHVGEKITGLIKALFLKAKSTTFSTNHTADEMLKAFLSAAETVLAHTLTGDKLEAVLQMIASGATGPALVAYLSTNFGGTLVDELLAVVGPLASQEAQILFGGKDGVQAAAMKALAQAAPGVATTQAAAKLSAAQVGASLAALSSPAGAR